MTAVDRTPSADGPALEELEPVRRALLDDARAQADRLVADARADADRALAAAQAEVDAAVERARSKAAASARARSEDELATARRDAYAAILAAQAELRSELVEEVRARLASVRSDPRAPRLVDHLVALARTQLGDGAEIIHDPDGGIVATAGPRRVDYRLTALADRAVEAAAEEVATLWT